MPDEIYDIFDEKGNNIGTASWTEVHAKGLLHKTTAILVFKDNSKSEVLLQKRSERMAQDPGLWQHSAGGHMLAGETPIENSRRELQEELFANRELPDIEIEEISSFFNNDMPNNNEILYLFQAVYSGPFYRGEELSDTRWIKLGDLLKDIKENPHEYTQAFRNVIEGYTKATKDE